jgi:D-sedoheptulose 7-phosphate isomerase
LILDKKLQKYIDILSVRYSILKDIKQDIIEAYLVMESCYSNGKKLLIAGNGGSAADAEHITGELMKCFKIHRPINNDFAEKLKKIDVVK